MGIAGLELSIHGSIFHFYGDPSGPSGGGGWGGVGVGLGQGLGKGLGKGFGWLAGQVGLGVGGGETDWVSASSVHAEFGSSVHAGPDRLCTRAFFAPDRLYTQCLLLCTRRDRGVDSCMFPCLSVV